MRLFITTLSMLSVISFGYALAGYGASLFGGVIIAEYVAGGLTGGIIFGGLALIFGTDIAGTFSIMTND